MKLKIFMILFVIINLLSYAKDDALYKDVSKEHWAYKAIENLVYKGVLTVDSDFFNGEQKITKYELAYYLSKVLNKLDDEKASKDDLLIIENLVYDFSKNLSDFGFNINKYTNKIKDLEKKLNLKTENETKNSKEIENLNLKIKKIESMIKTNNLKNTTSVSSNSTEKQFLSNSNYKLSLDYYISTGDINAKNYNSKYDSELKLYGNNYEFVMGKNSIDNNLVTKLKMDYDIIEKLKLQFYTKGYENKLYSSLGNIEYDNYDITNNEFNSYGLILKNDINIFNLEKNNSVLKIMDKVSTKYADIFLEYIPNEKENNLKYELLGKLSLIKILDDNLKLKLGYTKTNTTETNNMKIYNIIAEYSNFKIGYERKDGKAQFYNKISAETSYEVIKNGFIHYRMNYYDTILDTFINHYIIIENKIYGTNIYIGVNKKSIDEESFNIDTIQSNTTFVLDDFKKNQESTEIYGKIKYDFLKNLNFDIGYKNKKSNIENYNVLYLKLLYELNQNFKTYILYIKSDKDYIDNEKDFFNKDYNLNFDNEDKFIKNNKNGEIRIGMKIEF
ncbi:S-layer homology domain-containing protein [Haliovirga abyssi]|uniref:SLH domain-containing protein n=1 Tax=Haliovirga abyssi TaxID=2996794 RepID=A0AAU9DIQ9_9FUSO|nr:S-layer homology domain-containing protein [Haliovirga abyssi]BDU51487.1 hypothetical protein HLVA_20560 [Haliovirga abyssi]